MKWLDKFLTKSAGKTTQKKSVPKGAPLLFSGRPVPKPNKTEPFKKGIF
ncbi:MAG TPA: hypothetical protein VFO38_02875 [Candidatus Saccharimonadales bacterium]|nr:hypothetical protein [Candidatus Saccharimonadales bacterium]